jgi:hypothetical protein
MDGTMQIELRCPTCPVCLQAAPETPAAEILDRMFEEGPWFGLADGDTFEDMIAATLSKRGKIRCPDCLHSVTIREEKLPCFSGLPA